MTMSTNTAMQVHNEVWHRNRCVLVLPTFVVHLSVQVIESVFPLVIAWAHTAVSATVVVSVCVYKKYLDGGEDDREGEGRYDDDGQ